VGLRLEVKLNCQIAHACRVSILATIFIASIVSAQQPADPYSEVARYTFGQSRNVLTGLEAGMRAVNREQLRDIEAKLLTVIQSPDATLDGKVWACTQLRLAGSQQSVGVLVGLLGIKDLAPVALLALLSIPDSIVDDALRSSIGKVEGALKAGVIQTIGARRDVSSVKLLEPLVRDKDHAVAASAIAALGSIGNKDALVVLRSAKVPDALRNVRATALLKCADVMADNSQAGNAAGLYRELFSDNDSIPIKVCALRGVLATDRKNALALVEIALKSDSLRLRVVAAASVAESGGADIIRTLFAKLSSFPVDVQAGLLGSVQDKAVLTDVIAVAGSQDESVRLASLEALKRLGDVGCLPLLIRIAATEQSAVQAAARSALQSVAADGIDKALAAMAKVGEAAVRVEAIRALRARGVSSSSEVLLKLVEDSDQAVRGEAIKALDDLASASNLPAAIKLLMEARPEDAGPVEQMVIAGCRRSENKDAAASCVAGVWPGPDAAVRIRLIHVLSKIKSEKSLGVLRIALGDNEPTVKDAAIRGLADWPDAGPLDDVMRIAGSEGIQVHKIIALRGALRMISMQSKRSADETVKLISAVKPFASGADDKKLVLATLAGVNSESSLAVAVEYLSDKDVEVEAATAVVQITKVVHAGNPGAAEAAMKKILEVCKTPAARKLGSK